jgi:hypothetical protein
MNKIRKKWIMYREGEQCCVLKCWTSLQVLVVQSLIATMITMPNSGLIEFKGPSVRKYPTMQM